MQQQNHFMARQMQENFTVKGKKLYFGFVDSEKAFDRVSREVNNNNDNDRLTAFDPGQPG